MKILIYMPENNLKPIGGPSGYLYNLYTGLMELGTESVDFLPPLGERSSKSSLKAVYHSLPYKFRSKLMGIYNSIKRYFVSEEKEQQKIYHNYRELLFGKSMLPADFQAYDGIHFHTTFELYRERDLLKNYKGKIILNSHSPQPNHQEYIVLFNNHPSRNEVLPILEEADKFAFDRADLILFPCEDAEEPYFNGWAEYAHIHQRNRDKYRYLLTGIRQCFPKIPETKIRQKYNIPPDAFLICYVGRHNEIKGYNILKNVAEKILPRNEKIYFIIAGKEGPLYGLDNPRWIEAGWTDDPHSIINAANVFILPNRETYFDLILLEVMSLGIPVIASNTGGNKYFKKHNCTGIQFYDSEQELENKILYLSKNTHLLDGKANKEFFKAYLNEKTFAQNYIQMMQYEIHGNN